MGILVVMLSLLQCMVRTQPIPSVSGEVVRIVTTLLVPEETKVLISALDLFLMLPGDGKITANLIMKLNVSLKNYINISAYNHVIPVFLLNVMLPYKLSLVMNHSVVVMLKVSTLEPVGNLVKLLYMNVPIGLK